MVKTPKEKVLLSGMLEARHLGVLREIAKNVRELPLRVSRKGFTLRALCSSRISAYDWEVVSPYVWLDFSAIKGGYVDVSINSDLVETVLKNTFPKKKGALAKMRLTKDALELGFKYDGVETSQTVKVDGSKEIPPIATLTEAVVKSFTVKFTLTDDDQKRLIKLLKDYGDTCHIRVVNRKIQVKLKDWDTETCITFVGETTAPEDDKGIALNSDVLRSLLLVGNKTGADDATFEYGKSSPMRLTYNGDTNTRLVMFLAPKIVDDF